MKSEAVVAILASEGLAQAAASGQHARRSFVPPVSFDSPQYKHSKNTFCVTSIALALTLVPLVIKLLQLPAQLLIGD